MPIGSIELRKVGRGVTRKVSENLIDVLTLFDPLEVAFVCSCSSCCHYVVDFIDCERAAVNISDLGRRERRGRRDLGLVDRLLEG